MVQSRIKHALIALGVAALYVGSAKLGLALAIQAEQVTAVWPATGFALAAVLLFGRSSLIGIAVGAFIANATAAEPLGVAAMIAAGNTLEALAGAAILRRAGYDSHFARVRDVIALLAAVMISPLIAATVGVAALGLGGVQPLASLPGLWWLWWLGDCLGGLVVAPLLLVWSNRDAVPTRQSSIVEGSILLALFFPASAMAFVRLPETPATEYIVFPFLIWGALRFGPLGAATMAAVTNAIAVWGTHIGRGPFAGAGPEQGLVLLQIFMAIAATTGLLLGAVVAQNRGAQQRAEVSERRLLLAMEGARIGAFDWDIRSGQVIWSQGLDAIHGMAPDSFAGTFDAFRDLIHPGDRRRVEEAIWKSVDGGTPYEADFRIVGPDGIVRWIAARGQVLLDDSGRAARMVGVGIDVSRSKGLEEELRRQAFRLAEADRQKDEFLAMLGHELRNPLAPIVHAAELLGRDEPEINRRARQIIRRQSEHLMRLVDDLLDVSRITRGTVKIERRLVKLSDVLTPALDAWRHLISQRKQLLIVEIPEKPVWLDVDPTRFTQVIANLIHNASKFTPEDGRIAVTAVEEDGHLALRVRDTGEGMSREVIEKAFDLFAQGSSGLDRARGGLGLGLTLVRRLVEAHGGSVEAQSGGMGHGTEITVRVPLAEGPAEAEPERPAVEPASGPRLSVAERSKRVLVVEDNTDAREALSLLLEQQGHEVRSAADGPRALLEARRFQPEVVLLDIGLPGLDGYSVARALRATPQCSAAVLVAITGYGQPDDVSQATAAGFDHHLLKPVDPPRLFDLLRHV